MSGPLERAARDYLGKERARLHMPGHKGRPLPGLGDVAQWDLTEVEGLDSLYHADGAIARSEAAFAELYGSEGCFLSAGGSTLCIQVMLALAVKPGEKLLLGRGVHQAAVHAMALLDLHPAWLMPDMDEMTGLARAITPAQVEAGLQAHPDARAVYLTSPNYFGTICDVAAIAAVCHDAGVPLLVDNAHGAHLRFLERDGMPHPMEAGADLCADSLHKTMPVLTGGALLHVGNAAYLRDARARMALFGSTSPSYPIMLSADGVLDWLRGDAAAEMETCCAKLDELRALAAARGFLLPRGVTDPMRLALGAGPLGHDGEMFGAHLRACGVEPEYVGGRFVVLMASPCNDDDDFSRVRTAIETLPRREALPAEAVWAGEPRRACSIREAVFAGQAALPVEKAAGRIAGSLVAPCPPGTALATPGERLDAALCAALKLGGIRHINVVE